MRRRNKGQRNQQLSDEELQRTQVLNLQDFKETARFERMTSKKPAIWAGSVGILLIVLGLLFPTLQSITTRQKIQARKQERVEPIEKKPTVIEEDIVCHWEQLNKENGTDENIDTTFHFKDDELVSAIKEYKLTKSPTYQGTPSELSSYLTALQSFLMQTSGYSVSVQAINDGSITTTKVDYPILDPSKIPAQHQENYRFKVTQKEGLSKEQVKTNMESLGYMCK